MAGPGSRNRLRPVSPHRISGLQASPGLAVVEAVRREGPVGYFPLPREDVAEQILTAARAQLEGYLVVEGPPGCGKTTLATWLANEHEDDLHMRYHVFDPKRASGLERRQRASALEFVATMFDVLSARFPGLVPPRLPSLDRLAEAVGVLRDQLARLADGGPRFVIVDGIDHVIRAGLDRETHFEALPQPVPSGIVFILFGQPECHVSP